jgi:hypothetical protein
MRTFLLFFVPFVLLKNELFLGACNLDSDEVDDEIEDFLCRGSELKR